MATFLFDAHVFGPIQSRRLGQSLGVNLLPTEYKICNFNCIYCECGFTDFSAQKRKIFPPATDIIHLLETRIRELIDANAPLDSITFAGNGEPTLHPEFPKILAATIEIRDRLFPQAIVSVLSNGSTLQNPRIFKALQTADKAILKLDAGTNEMIHRINQPLGRLEIAKLKTQFQQLGTTLVVQSLFLKGEVDGKWFNNASLEAVEKWTAAVLDIAPPEVQLYSLDRDTPMKNLEAIPAERLEEIAAPLRISGIRCNITA